MGEVLASVIVPVLDEESCLRACAGRMLRQDVAAEVEYLFVDGGSRDGSREILADLARLDPRVRILDNPSRHIPFALNIGLRAARGEYVARMDAHTEYPQEYIRLGVERLRRGDAVSVSGPQLAEGDGPWSRPIALALATSLGVGGARFRRYAEEEFEVDTGFTGMWRRDVLERAGGWDEAWLTDEDCELAFRLSADGGRHVCVPAMAARYLPRGSLSRLSRQYWRYGRHKIKTFRRHPGAMRPSHLLPPVLALTVACAALGPPPLRRLSRLGVLVHAGAVAAATAAADARRPADTAALPLVIATMHLSYGFGLLAGIVRDGLPAAAVASALRRLARS